MEANIDASVKRALSDLPRFTNNEKWTVTSVIITTDDKFNFKKTVAFGCGIKCLADIDLKEHSDQLVHDCHAEILCRRAFNSFLMQELSKCKHLNFLGNEFIEFDATIKKWRINRSSKLIFYTSCSPCGDATISNYFNADLDSKKIKFDHGLAEGRDHPHLTGILRTKPGRKDSPKTFSLSCSDKMASWNILGIQGALLSNFFAPIYIDVLAVGVGFDRHSCTRALISRIESISLPQYLLDCGYKNNSMNLMLVSCPYTSSSSQVRDETCSFWYSGMSKFGHIVQGFKKGSKKPVKNQEYSLSLQSPLSREYLFKNIFQSLCEVTFSSYQDAKIAASCYQKAKTVLLADPHFCDWPVKDKKMKEHRKNLLKEE